MLRRQQLADAQSRETFRPAEMKRAARVGRGEFPDRASHNIRTAGTTEFVGEKTERFARTPRMFHLFVEPAIPFGGMAARQRNANDRMLRMPPHYFLRRNFRPTISGERIRLIF